MKPGINSAVSAGVQGRKRVDTLVAVDAKEALRVAERIEHPWYRCQALAVIAQHVENDAEARKILLRSLAAAHELDQPNRVVTVACWPLRESVKRGLGGEGAVVDQLLAIIVSEPHSLRRSHALLSLHAAVFADATLRDRVRSALLAALSISSGWRAERAWSSLIMLTATESIELANKLAEMMPAGKQRSRVERHVRALLEDRTTA